MAFKDVDWKRVRKEGKEMLIVCMILAFIAGVISLPLSLFHQRVQDDNLCFNDMNLNDARRTDNGELFCRVSDKHPWIKYEKPTQDKTD